MAKLTWDVPEERIYETGVDHGVLWVLDPVTGKYQPPVVWNGLTAVPLSPEGAESNPQYADNIKYLNLVSAEDFKFTIEAFTYPKEFEVCDGSATLNGITVGQQPRVPFLFSYRTLVGNAVKGTDYGYKIHLMTGCQAAPSSRDYATVNDSPEALTFSWEISTTPVSLDGFGQFKPSAKLTFDTTKMTPAQLSALEEMLYGSDQNPAEALDMSTFGTRLQQIAQAGTTTP